MVECESLTNYDVYYYACSFNRYMVECESSIKDIIFFNLLGFNRYMVECEFICCQIKRTAEIVLIDTWWNVNVI